MPALVNHGGDFYRKRSLCSDVCLPFIKKARVAIPTIFSIEKDISNKQEQEAKTIDSLPDECLYEILRRLRGHNERSNSACVSKRWLKLLSGIRPAEIPTTNNKVSREASRKPQFDLNGYPAAIEEEEVETEKGDYLTRCLSGKEATDNRLAAISVGINGCGGLGELLIRGSHPSRGVTDLGLSCIARGCPSLKVLSLSNIPSVTDDGLSEIADGCPLLERIYLAKCSKITDKGLIAIARKCPKLAGVTLESCSGIENEGLRAIGRSCSMLNFISIKDCAGVGDPGIASLVSSASASLTKIKFQGVNITDASLAVIGHYGKAVKDLFLSGIKNVNERGFWVMGSARGLQILESLVIDKCDGVTDRGLEAIAKGSPNLKQLSLCKCDLVSDTGIVTIAQHARALENLRVESCNQVTFYGVLAALCGCNPKFKNLALVKCSGIKDIGHYPAQLPYCGSLHSLTIKDCPGFTSSSLVVVEKICPNLQQIDLIGLVHVTDAGLLPLVQSSRSCLVKVDLSGCVNLTDTLISALVRAHGGTLKSLIINRCKMVTDKSLLAIGEFCAVLEELEMSRCSVTDYGVALLASSRLINLKALSLSGCSNVTDRSLPFLGNLGRSLVGLNLLQCNKISADVLCLLDEKLWWCDILS